MANTLSIIAFPLEAQETTENDIAAAVALALADMAPSTRKAYAADFRSFDAWCSLRGRPSLPASHDIVAAFLAHEATNGVRPSTLSRRMAAIQYAHKLSGFASPTDNAGVKATMRGIRRTFGTAKARKAPAVAAKIKAMVLTTTRDISGIRDRALLLLGFAGALRRSELVALNVADVRETDDGLLVRIIGSKTDQQREGVTIAISRGNKTCPVEAMREWMISARIDDGPIFRAINKAGAVSPNRLSDRSVAHIVKRYAEKAGLDPTLFSGHSLRAGFLTSAAGNGASILKMMDVSRHKSVDTLRSYVRDADLFKNHAGNGLL